MGLLRTTYPKARKQHMCEFCFTTIEQNEKHQCQTIINDGTIDTLRVCSRCEAVMENMFKEGYTTYDGSINLDLFQEYAHENDICLVSKNKE